MYLKFRGLCKRVHVIMLGAVMLCLLSSCATTDGDSAKGGTESTKGPVENSSVCEVDNESQYSEASNSPPQASADVNNEQSNSISDGYNENSSLLTGERYKAILLGNGEFLSTDLYNKELSLEDIREAVTDDDSITVKATQFAIIDLDGDGENEIVLWLLINGVSDYGFEILRYQDEKVYGYTLPYRAFMNLKTDGTFEFSGGVADSGIGKLKFLEDGYTIEKLVYSDSQYNAENELKVQYFAYGEACSEEEYNTAMSQQEAKKDVSWYELTADSVNLAFENIF